MIQFEQLYVPCYPFIIPKRRRIDLKVIVLLFWFHFMQRRILLWINIDALHSAFGEDIDVKYI